MIGDPWWASPFLCARWAGRAQVWLVRRYYSPLVHAFNGMEPIPSKQPI